MNDLTLPCLRAWPKLAAHAGCDVEAVPQFLREDGSVIRFGDVVLKHAPDGFHRVVRAHRQAARIMRGNALDRAVQLMGFDAAEQVVMVAFAPGQPLGELAASGHDPVALCGFIGRWLRRFHDGRESDVAQFDGKRPLGAVPLSTAYLSAEFAAARARLTELAAAVQDTPQTRAVLHGDLNASNLIVQGETVTGIDFGNIRLHPAMRDAGQALAQVHLLAGVTPDRLLPETWRRAFEADYGTTGELLDFFVLQRVMLQWARLPANAAGLGSAKFHMALALEEMFA